MTRVDHDERHAARPSSDAAQAHRLIGAMAIVVTVVMAVRLLAPCASQTIPVRAVGVLFLAALPCVGALLVGRSPRTRTASLVSLLGVVFACLGMLGIVMPAEPSVCRHCPEVQTIDGTAVDPYFVGPDPVPVSCRFTVRGRSFGDADTTMLLLHKEPGQVEWSASQTGSSGGGRIADWTAQVDLCREIAGEREIVAVAAKSPPPNRRMPDRFVDALCPSRVYHLRLTPIARASKAPAILEFYLGEAPGESQRRLAGRHVVANVRHTGSTADIDWDDGRGFERLAIDADVSSHVGHTYDSPGPKRVQLRVSDDRGVDEMQTFPIEVQ